MSNAFTSIPGLVAKAVTGILRWRPWRDNYGPGIRRAYSPDSPAILHHEQALTVPAYTAALRRCQTTIGKLPLLTYEDIDNSPELAPQHAAYYLLNQRPNPSMSRTHWLQKIVFDTWQYGDSYNQLRFANNGKFLGAYPIDPEYVIDIILEDDWTRTYIVRTITDGLTAVPDSQMLHIHYVSRVGLGNGIRGCPMWLECAETLGLCRQVIESATAYYQNAMLPSMYATFPRQMTTETRAEVGTDLHDNYGGPKNRGKVPVIDNGGELKTISQGSARESDLVKSIAQATQQVSQITGVSPIQLGDFSAAHYNTLMGDNTQFYQAAIHPFLEIIEQEINYKVFGKESDFFCRFDTDSLLRGDRQAQAEINATEIQAGYRLRSEAREEVGLAYLPEMEAVTMPINMGGNPQLTAKPNQDINKEVDEEPNDTNQSTDQENPSDQADDQ